MKGLFLICTLLGLVGFTNSLVDKGKLAELKEKQQQVKERLEKVKNDRRSTIGSSSDLLNDYINEMDHWTALKGKFDYPLSVETLMKTKDFLVKTKSFIDKTNDNLGIQIEQIEKEWKQTENLISFYEEQEAKCPG